MLNFLDKLRRKPESVKKLIAFSASAGFAGLIFVVWLSVVWPDWNFKESQLANASASDPSPVTAIFSTFGGGADVLKDQVGEIKSALSNLPSEGGEKDGSLSTSTSTTTESVEY